jgi:tubulin--tyrosine ligase like protein 10
MEKPLLLNGKKFDIRCYVLIVRTAPMLVLFHHGYLRLSLFNYIPGININFQKKFFIFF